LVEEHEEQLEEEEAEELADESFPNEPYLPFPTFEISLRVFFDLHLGHTALGFSPMLMVKTSNCFLHLSH
jgi:hypothetical protein